MIVAQADPLSLKDATALEKKILKGIDVLEADLLRFLEGKGWLPLGYQTYLEWFDAKVVSVRVGPAIRAVIVHELQAPDPKTGRKLTDREAAGRVGAGKTTVQRDSGREKIKSGPNGPESINKTPPALPEPDTNIIDVEVIEDSSPDGTADDNTPIPTIEANDDGEDIDSDYAEIVSELTKIVGRGKRLVVKALQHPRVTPDIPRLVMDEVIPELEAEVQNALKGIEEW